MTSYLFCMKLIHFWMFASIVRFISPLWEYCHENLFWWFEWQCDEYLRTVEMPRFVRQSGCLYTTLANHLRYVPEERRFDRFVLTQCIRLFDSRMVIQLPPPVVTEPLVVTEPINWWGGGDTSQG
jgi:hypothetical protein